MDPLRPFAGLIRTLWKSQSGAAARTGSTIPKGTTPSTESLSPESAGVAAGGAETQLTDRVRARLVSVGIADPRRARDTFIETVLVAELGEGLARDPALNAVVARVSEQIGADPALAAQLQVLLERLVAAV